MRLASCTKYNACAWQTWKSTVSKFKCSKANVWNERRGRNWFHRVDLFFFKDLLVPGFTVTFAVLRCFIRKCTQRTCLAGFKATATSQGENAPACEPSRKFISWTLSRYSTWVEYERHGWFTEMNPVWWKTLAARGFSIVVRLASAKLPARAT